jgi:hypothetical protein
MDDFIFVVVIGAMTLGLGALAGSSMTDWSWRQDCEKLGSTRSGDKVYECHLKAQ